MNGTRERLTLFGLRFKRIFEIGKRTIQDLDRREGGAGEESAVRVPDVDEYSLRMDTFIHLGVEARLYRLNISI